MTILSRLTLISLLTCMSIGVSAQGETKSDKESAIITLTEEAFYKQIADIRTSPDTFKYLGKRPCLIDFYADWCGPCRMLTPTLNQLATEYAGKVDFYKINVDNEQKLASAFSIRSIPTLLFIPMEGRPTLMQGAAPKEELKKMIEDLLLKKPKE